MKFEAMKDTKYTKDSERQFLVFVSLVYFVVTQFRHINPNSFKLT